MRQYHFRDQWTVRAPREAVWELISDPTNYPRWWPIYQEAIFLKNTGGVGSMVRLRFRVLLPYTLTIVTTTTHSDPPGLAEGTVAGELVGSWRWQLESEPGGTRVTFEEWVGTNKWILDLLAPLAFKLFEQNHRIAAERGAKGMRSYFRRMGVAST
jgi:hypothetical protein